MVSNTCIDRLRAQTRWHWTELDPLLERAASAADSPLQQLLHKEAEHLLWEVLAHWPADCRALWDLIVQGLGYREIGARLGMAEGALRVRATRCRRKAAALLAELTRRGERIRVIYTTGHWLDVDSLEDVLAASEFG